MLKFVTPAITLADTWDSVKERAKGEEYDSIDESNRVEVFDSYLVRLKEKELEVANKRLRDELEIKEHKKARLEGESSEEEGEVNE